MKRKPSMSDEAASRWMMMIASVGKMAVGSQAKQLNPNVAARLVERGLCRYVNAPCDGYGRGWVRHVVPAAAKLPAVPLRVCTRGYGVLAGVTVVHLVEAGGTEAVCGVEAKHGWNAASDGAPTCHRCAWKIRPDRYFAGKRLVCEFTWSHGSTTRGYGYFLEIRGYFQTARYAGLIDSDEGASLLAAMRDEGVTPDRLAVFCDWLEDHAEKVVGLSPVLIREALPELRWMGFFFAKRDTKVVFHRTPENLP